MTASLMERMSDIGSDRKENGNINSQRRISDDIASLDSWSEALTPDSEDSPSLSNRRHSSSSNKSAGKRKSVKKSGNNFYHDNHNRSRRYSGNNDPLVLSPARLANPVCNLPPRPRVEEQKLLSSGNYDGSQFPGTSHRNDQVQHQQTSNIYNHNCDQTSTTRPNQYYHNYRHNSAPKSPPANHYALYPNLSQFSPYREPYHQTQQLKNNPNQLSKSYQHVQTRNEFMDSPPISASSTFPQYSRNRTPVDIDDIDQGERVKNKLISVWNNVKYGWTLKTKTAFRVDSPIFLLGKCYHIRPSDDDPKPGEKIKVAAPSMEQFKQDFSSRIWFTYRQDFPTIAGTKFSTDCGWGCMLRSGQMMLAQAFVNHYLGRDWNVFHHQSREQDTYRKQIIRWFGDFPSDDSPFSIHRLAEIGKSHGKQPGDWYGPSSVAYILRDAMIKSYDTQPVLSDICLYVAQDCTIYKQDVYDMCSTRPRTSTKFTSSTESESGTSSTSDPTTNSEDDWRRAVVILIPVRLGGEEINPAYGPCVKSLLAQDSCIGIMGGKPKHSLYFVGWQENKLIYLDPHYCQDAVDSRKRNFPIQTYHCLSPRKILVDKMDPSCTIGFYCRTKSDFLNFIKQTEEMVSPPKQKLSYPMFVFSEGRGADINVDSLSLEEEKLLRIRHVKIDGNGKIRSSTVDSEEFVIL